MLDFVADRRAGREGDPHDRQDLLGGARVDRGPRRLDIVVVDAAATGHIVAQLGAADAIQELVDVGPVRDADASGWRSSSPIPAITAVNVVTTPEEMPVAETIELVARLRARGRRCRSAR